MIHINIFKTFSNFIHVVIGIIVAYIDTFLTLSTSILYIAYQYIDIRYNNEDPKESQMDIAEYIAGIIIGSIVKAFLH